MNFKDCLLRAQNGDTESAAVLMEMYRPLLLKESILNGVFDEDLYQELCETLLRCIHSFQL